MLECLYCLQRLCHIGVDYDRPIENQHCNICDTIFIKACKITMPRLLKKTSLMSLLLIIFIVIS
ncbi:MAG: hypothetical protein KAH18_06250 [Psychromonas sp.]|nr:hypothetical protein [Psychromonas sp.]